MAKRMLPRISETEMIALRAGTVSIDREIFEGKVKSKFPIDIGNKKYIPQIYFNDINKNMRVIGDKPMYNGKFDDIQKNLEYLGKEGYFSFNIPKKYKGISIPIETQSHLLTKLSSFNPSLGVIVMVPNSLGPAELLLHYGTDEQKDKYLPSLADGSYIPCFGLTGPENGSDAGGKIDEGIIIVKNGKTKIKAKINKRYITLAPVSNLIGLAIKVSDPSNYLKGKYDGITVCLLEKNHPNLKLETHHNPLNVGFPNGTIKGEIEIDLEDVIGGQKNIGNGWKMLMECLAAGRGISLPASALGSSLTTWYGVSGYANLREQFKIPLSKMQGVQEKLANITYQSWTSFVSIKYTNRILDSGEKPSVISAIMKQQITERGRNVLLDGMDIYAGSAICLGENNFIEKYYQAAPVGITVEGSNTLTRSLIIFGQGLNKSHPFISDVVKSIQDGNKEDYVKYIGQLVNHSISLYLQNITNIFKVTSEPTLQIINLTSSFANLSNIVALMGGKLKKEQRLSGFMADYLSNLYLAHALIECNNEATNNNIKKLNNYCLKRLINEIKVSQDRILEELPLILRIIASPTLKSYSHKFNSEDNVEMSNILWKDNEIREMIESHISLNNVLSKIKNANITKDKAIKDRLVWEIIQVGEKDNN